MSSILGNVGDDRRDSLSFVYNCIIESIESSSVLEKTNVCGHRLVQK